MNKRVSLTEHAQVVCTDIIAFENHRFRPSTRPHREAGVKKNNSTLRTVFENLRFLVPEN